MSDKEPSSACYRRLAKNAWMLRTRSRTEYGGPSCYRWRRSGSDLRMNARTALGFSRYKPNGQRCNSNSRLNPTTTRRNRLPQLGVCISVARLEICFVHFLGMVSLGVDCNCRVTLPAPRPGSTAADVAGDPGENVGVDVRRLTHACPGPGQQKPLGQPQHDGRPLDRCTQRDALPLARGRLTRHRFPLV
jgi:hypothetical protein